MFENYWTVIWLGVVLFIALVITAVLLYFQSDRFDRRYRKNIEIIRAIKTQKLWDYMIQFYDEDSFKQHEGGERKDFPSIEDYREVGKKMLKSNSNLNKLMKKSADLKMWFDYGPRAKDFLVSAALWLFMLSLAVLAFCLALWVELINVGHIQYSGYISFLWIFMGIRLFKNLLRYNMVTKNINKHMDLLRDGNIESF